ncbi:hypothetical protein SKAU_G00188180 [Synaphobranchus kaupii]|uniref:Secreted protein n=1 Tax=Synaphobranchus kaupii TaxID=118154 RepID=A0A9Q1FD57_SYNKA|nr:hypothetical protein SKAU_G00188180 [Synaphobranchus kaupii]
MDIFLMSSIWLSNATLAALEGSAPCCCVSEEDSPGLVPSCTSASYDGGLLRGQCQDTDRLKLAARSARATRLSAQALILQTINFEPDGLE